MERYRLPFPEVRFSKRLFEVIFQRPDLQINNYKTRVIEGKEIKLEKTVEKIINAIGENSKITQKELVKMTGLTRRGVEWNIKKLKKEGIIRRVGSARSGYWEVVK